jgi:hypothetical protein
MESIDKAIHGMVRKSSGCNESERTQVTSKTLSPGFLQTGDPKPDVVWE